MTEQISPRALARSARPSVRLHRPGDPSVGLGLAVAHLMSKPAFAQLRFGAWSRVLTGQVNRGHYALALDAGDRAIGFLGWALADRPRADAWLRGAADFAGEDGDCLVGNAWSAETPATNALLLRLTRELLLGRRWVYFRRLYPDGRSRAAALPAGAFIAAHLSRIP